MSQKKESFGFINKMSSILTNRHELQCCLSDFPYPSVQCSAKRGEFTRYSQRPRLSRKWYDVVHSVLQFGLGVCKLYGS